MVGHGEGFGGPLGFVIDAAWADRVDVAPIGFGLGMHQRVAVDLGGGGEQEDRPPGVGQVEQVAGAECTHLQSLDRMRGVVDRGGGRGEMQDRVHRAAELEWLADVVPQELELGSGLQGAHVAGIAGE